MAQGSEVAPRSRKRTERTDYSSYGYEDDSGSSRFAEGENIAQVDAGNSSTSSGTGSSWTRRWSARKAPASGDPTTAVMNTAAGKIRTADETRTASSGKRNHEVLQRKWRETVQKQRELRRRASEMEQRQLNDGALPAEFASVAAAAAADWEDVEDPRRTNSMRARSLRISAKLRKSIARRKRRPTSAPEGKEKRKLMVRFDEEVTVRCYELAQDELDEDAHDAEIEVQDPEYGAEADGNVEIGDGHLPLDTREVRKKIKRRSKRRSKTAKRARSPEYTREAEFFDAIQDWCRRELTDVSYEGAGILEFLPPKRASAARSHHIETYEDLVHKCRRFVNDQIYEPSSLEQDSSAFAIHTEEIIASLVRDCLEEFLTYRVEKRPREFDALCHDCFYIARDLVLARRDTLAQGAE